MARTIFVGYVAGCGVALFALVVHMGLKSLAYSQWPAFGAETVLGLIGSLGMLYAAIFVLAGPGFLVMRLLLGMLRRVDWPSFAIAGGILGLVMTVLFFGPQTSSMDLFLKYPPSPVFMFMGALAGAVACLTERWLARGQRSEADAT